jgi:UPF0755 protein
LINQEEENLQSRWIPRRKLSGCFFFLFLLFVLLGIAVVIGYYWLQSNTAPTASGVEKVIVVRPGETTREVAEDLEKNQIIKNALAFSFYLKLNRLNPNIQAGSFKIKSGLTIMEVLDSLSVGRIDKWLTLREGLRKEEMAEAVAKEFPIKAEDFLALSKEGYLFPDTYLLPTDATAEKVISILKTNFDFKVTEEIKSQISKQGLSLDQALILASIVERESRAESERATIAGILLQRLKDKHPLEVDATIQYALGYQTGEKTWWKKTLTNDDLQINSPFNSRRNVGLPPTPICNPGLSAIKAVASPTKSDYYFYLHDKDGKVHFAKTLDEHNANVAKYLQ